VKGTKEEHRIVEQMYDLYAQLKTLGWKEPDSKEPEPGSDAEILIVEAGSAGIHYAKRDEEGDFWIWNNYDTDRGEPILWRPK
jgi:hypothetical protein